MIYIYSKIHQNPQKVHKPTKSSSLVLTIADNNGILTLKEIFMKNDPLGEACRHLANSQTIIEKKNAEIERLRLTDDERDAINWAAELACADDDDEYSLRKAWVLQSLLERTKNQNEIK